MKCSYNVSNDREEVIIYAAEGDPTAMRICELCREDELLIGQDGGGVVRLSPSTVEAFSVQGGSVVAVTADGSFTLRERLYTLEERFGKGFIRINQSTLVRRSAIRRFDTSIGGSLRVSLSCGFSDYISRRQVTAVKKGLGLK